MKVNQMKRVSSMHAEIDSVYSVYILIFIHVRQLAVEKSSRFTVRSSVLSPLQNAFDVKKQNKTKLSGNQFYGGILP